MPGFASVFELAALFKMGLTTLLSRAAGALEGSAAASTKMTTLIEVSLNGRNFIPRILLSIW